MADRNEWWRFRVIGAQDRFAWGTEADAAWYAQRIRAHQYCGLSERHARNLGLRPSSVIALGEERRALEDDF